MNLRPSSVRKRERILDAAETLFLDVGYDAVTMNGIAEAAGVAKQTLYSHFSSKESLFVDLVTAITTATGDVVVDTVLPPDGSAEQVLVAHLGRQLDAVLQPRVLRVRRLVIGEVTRFPELAAALWEHGPRVGMERIGALLTTLQERGLVRVDDPDTAAEQLNWLVMGGPLNAAMMLGDHAAPAPGRRRAHVTAAVRVFLARYGTT